MCMLEQKKGQVDKIDCGETLLLHYLETWRACCEVCWENGKGVGCTT